ncbi:DUF1877 family protein [Tsukamurella serpentis]
MSAVATYIRVTESELSLLSGSSFDLDAFYETREEWDDKGRVTDIDKAHDALDAVLTAQGFPAPLVFAGTPIADSDNGYGPMRGVPAADVRAAAAAVAAHPVQAVITAESVRSAAGIGPVQDWSTPDTIDYLRSAYSELAEFYTAAAESGQAALIAFE